MKNLIALILIGLSLSSMGQGITITENNEVIQGADSTAEGSPLIKKKNNDYPIRTIFGKKGKKMTHGFYVGYDMSYSDVLNQDALFIGGRLGYIMNHSLALGFGGKGLATPVVAQKNYSGDRDLLLSMGYGGFIFEPIIASKEPIHVSFPVLIGGGGGGYFLKPLRSNPLDDPDEIREEDILGTDAFFVLEPGVNVEFNLTKFLRLGLRAEYRLTTNQNIISDRAENFDGLSLGFELRGGIF